MWSLDLEPSPAPLTSFCDVAAGSSRPPAAARCRCPGRHTFAPTCTAPPSGSCSIPPNHRIGARIRPRLTKSASIHGRAEDRGARRSYLIITDGSLAPRRTSSARGRRAPPPCSPGDPILLCSYRHQASPALLMRWHPNSSSALANQSLVARGVRSSVLGFAVFSCSQW